MSNKTIGLLAILGVILILGGNFIFQNQPWISNYWYVSDTLDVILLLILASKSLKSSGSITPVTPTPTQPTQ